MKALFAFVAAFVVAWAATRLLLALSLRRRFLDVPNDRSSHEVPKPRFGGIALFVAMAVSVSGLCVVDPAVRGFAPALLGALLLFSTGVVDDLRGLPVSVRFAAQFAAAAVPVALGLGLDHVTLPVVGHVVLGKAGPVVTVLFVVACVNFYNFIDGIDGLAAGAAFIGALFLSLIGMILGHSTIALLFLSVSGAAVGFLQYNFPPSSLFMGDSGSTVLGYVFAVLALAGNAAYPEIPVFIPLLILSSLFLDAGLTLLARFLRGEKIFQAHHTHYYQRLLSLGLNHKQVTLLEYALTTALGVGAVVYFKSGRLFAPFLTLCWLAVFTGVILKIRSLERGDNVFWKARALFVVGADVILIAAAYIGSYFLRMNFQFTDAEGRAMLQALPMVVVVRTAVFYKYGLYRSMWKYMSVSDVVRVVKAVTTGSVIILTAVVLLYRFVAFPRTLFVIEYVLLTLLVLSARFSFRLFREIGRETQDAPAVRYAVVGAGDFGERLARGIKSRDGAAASIECFVDDSPEKIGLVLHDATVEGPVARLEDICRRRRIDMVVIGVRAPDADLSGRVVAACERAGVALASRHGEAGIDGEPWEVTLLRIARMPGRRLPDLPPAGRFRGRKFLVLRAGGQISRLLPEVLTRAGGEVFVHVESISAAEPRLPGVSYGFGSLASAEQTRELFELSRADTVIIPALLDAPGASDAWVWAHFVEETNRVVDEAGRAGADVVLVSLWNHVGHDHDHAVLAALSEGIAFSAAPGVSVRAVRLPAILTPSDVRVAQVDAAAVWDLTELEAARIVSACIDAPPRGLFSPVWKSNITAMDVRRAVAGQRTMEGRPAAIERHAPLFPAERTHRMGDGLVRISGPIEPPSTAVATASRAAWQAGSSYEKERICAALREKLGGLATERLGLGG